MVAPVDPLPELPGFPGTFTATLRRHLGMAWCTANVKYGSQLGLSQAASCGQDPGGPDAPVCGAVSNCQMCALLVYTNGLVSEAIRFARLALHLYLQNFSRKRNHRRPLRG